MLSQARVHASLPATDPERARAFCSAWFKDSEGNVIELVQVG